MALVKAMSTAATAPTNEPVTTTTPPPPRSAAAPKSVTPESFGKRWIQALSYSDFIGSLLFFLESFHTYLSDKLSQVNYIKATQLNSLFHQCQSLEQLQKAKELLARYKGHLPDSYHSNHDFVGSGRVPVTGRIAKPWWLSRPAKSWAQLRRL